MLSKKKIRHFEKQLRTQLMEVSGDLGQTHDLGSERSLRDVTKELSAYDNHPADLGSETYEQEKDLGLANAFRVRQAAIEEALERIKMGKYGVCRDCGRPIDEERLEAVPYVATCINCQQKAENSNELRYLPVEEELLSPPSPARSSRMKMTRLPDGEDAGSSTRWGLRSRPRIPGNIIYEEMYSDERGIVSDVELEQVQKV